LNVAYVPEIYLPPQAQRALQFPGLSLGEHDIAGHQIAFASGHALQMGALASAAGALPAGSRRAIQALAVGLPLRHASQGEIISNARDRVGEASANFRPATGVTQILPDSKAILDRRRRRQRRERSHDQNARNDTGMSPTVPSRACCCLSESGFPRGPISDSNLMLEDGGQHG